MNNKKMLLVISVITLLIVVLGATYAYFNVVGNSTGGTGSVTATSDTVGNVYLSGEGGTMHINLSLVDIANTNGGEFYATTTSAGFVTSEENLEIAKIEATSSPENTKYTCTFDVVVTPSDNSLSGVNGEVMFSTTSVDINDVTNDKILFDTLTEEKIYHASTILDSGDINYLYVSARITSSSTDSNESWLSGINGSFEVKTNNLKCTLSSSNEETSEFYSLSGKMLDEYGNPLTGYAVVASTPQVIELESDGSFEVKKIEAGSHNLYYMGNENPTGLSEAEVENRAITKTSFKTSNSISKDSVKFSNRSKIIGFDVKNKVDEVLYEFIKKNADTNTIINFNVRSGASGQETNGIYTTNNTQNGTSVYYYRGNVDNNIIFGGFCWKIIRTTITGGVKLLYNGVPNNGICNNTGQNTSIGDQYYTDSAGSNGSFGWMTGYYSSTYAATHQNVQNSNIKTQVDNWYKNNLLSYASYIEDTIYCSDRNLVAGGENNIYPTSYGKYGYETRNTGYGALGRSSASTITLNPTYSCKNTTGYVAENNDAFTVSSTLGNGKLTYPIGLITSDEAIFAGFTTKDNNNDYYELNSYIYSNYQYWTMTPAVFNSGCYEVAIYKEGVFGYPKLTNSFGMGTRPVISLKSGVKISSDGDGTVNNPYIVIE